MSELLFPGRTETNPDSVSGLDVVVGIVGGGRPTSPLEARREAARALRASFPGRAAAVVFTDDGGAEAGREPFFSEPMDVPGIWLATPPGVTGRGHMILNLLDRARELGAASVALIGREAPDTVGIRVQRLLEPTLETFSLVAPVYARSAGDASLTCNVAYPLLRSLFGKRVREPLGGDYGLSRALVDRLLSDVPGGAARGFGIDAWISTTAMACGLPVCQSFLGDAGGDGRDAPRPRPPELFSETLEAVFLLMQKHHDAWKSVRWSKPTVVFGVGARPQGGPAQGPFPADPAELYAGFQAAFPRFAPLWKKILQRDVFEKLLEVRKIPLETFEFPALMWALSLFAFALAYKRQPEDAPALMESLFALYLGRTCSTAISTAHMGPQQVEVYLEDQCRVFEETKPYLEYLWQKR